MHFTKSFLDKAKHPFSHRERERREWAKAELEFQKASPTLDFGSVTLVNPVYSGPHPYQGPEVFDPKNSGRIFIPVRKSSLGNETSHVDHCR